MSDTDKKRDVTIRKPGKEKEFFAAFLCLK
jgi:hypothetical protein